MQLGRRRSLPFLLSLPCPHSHLPISEREHLVCKTTKCSGVVVVVFISNKKHQMKKGSLGKKKEGAKEREGKEGKEGERWEKRNGPFRRLSSGQERRYEHGHGYEWEENGRTKVAG